MNDNLETLISHIRDGSLSSRSPESSIGIFTDPTALSYACEASEILSNQGVSCLVLPITHEYALYLAHTIPAAFASIVHSLDRIIVLTGAFGPLLQRTLAGLLPDATERDLFYYPVPEQLEEADSGRKSATLHQFESGADKVIRICLGLSPQDELLIVTDRSFLPTALIILNAGLRLQVRTTIALISDAQTDRVSDSQAISLTMRDAIGACNALLTVCDREKVAFRTSLLEYASERKYVSVGTMPGVTPSFFCTSIDADYSEIEHLADILSPILLVGRRVVIQTTDAQEGVHTLTFDMNGLQYLPFRSTGIIGRGRSGNIPSGECFANVVPGSAVGSYVCDGSFPGTPITRKEDELLLVFKAGRLERFWSASRSVYDSFADRVVDTTDGRRASFKENCDLPCEFGLGINRKVGDLIGIPINDEKKYGTIHIALGKNHHFGWGIQASQHIDMVSVVPTVSIDGQPLIAGGHYVAGLDGVVQAIADSASSAERGRSAVAVERTSRPYEVRNGDLRLRIAAWDGREESILVARGELAERLGRVLNTVEKMNRSLAPRSLAALGLSDEELGASLAHLELFGLVKPAS
jgi:aminopeptidase